ncbi:hypothetical protein KAI92_03305 [Candidatus Parcubacteria bacterium]|nr:hypothetical protein [Candidatus Parcubacteria bacterium]
MVNSSNSSFLYSIKIVGELFGDFLYFPLWWYSRGFVNHVKTCINFLNNRNRSLSYFVWIKNIFTPMYGQTDFWGRIISFFVRIIVVFFESILMFFWLLVILFIILLWLVAPIYVIYQIIFQLNIIN